MSEDLGPDCMYAASSFENRVPREYYSVVVVYERINSVQGDNVTHANIKTALKRLFDNNPVFKGRVLFADQGSGEGQNSRIIVRRRDDFSIANVYEFISYSEEPETWDKDNVGDEYISSTAGESLNHPDGLPPVKVRVTKTPSRAVVSFSLFEPFFGRHAQENLLTLFDENSYDGPAPLPAAFWYEQPASARPEFQEEVMRNESDVALLHDIYVASPNAIPVVIEKPRLCKMFYLSEEKLEDLAKEHIPDAMWEAGYTKTQIVASAIMWVAIMETRVQLRHELSDRETWKTRLDMMVSGHHVIETDEHRDALASARWPGNLDVPVVTRLPGECFERYPISGVQDETLVEAIKNLNQSLQRFNEGAFQQLAQQKVNIGYKHEIAAYNDALNLDWEGVLVENWSGFEFESLGGLVGAEDIYPKACLATVLGDCAAGTVRLHPQDKDYEAKVPIMVCLYDDEMDAIRVKLDQYC